MIRSILAATVTATLTAAALATPVVAAAPTFAVGASAVVLPDKPSFAPKPINFRHVYRVANGIYCVEPVSSLDWTSRAPLVAALPNQSKHRAGSILAAWEANGQRCPAAAVQVRTQRLRGARLTPANDVAFQILIGAGD